MIDRFYYTMLVVSMSGRQHDNCKVLRQLGSVKGVAPHAPHTGGCLAQRSHTKHLPLPTAASHLRPYFWQLQHTMSNNTPRCNRHGKDKTHPAFFKKTCYPTYTLTKRSQSKQDPARPNMVNSVQSRHGWVDGWSIRCVTCPTEP
jgi:hypothetical protein